jgi:hypothetical protein
MRPRFALAALFFLVSTASAPAFDRNDVRSGDVVFGDILVPRTLDEYAIQAARGSYLTLVASGVAPRPISPALGIYTDDYQAVGLLGTSPASLGSAGALDSARYRIIVAGLGTSVGAYRLKATLKPATKFTFAGGAGAATPQLTFGAYEGFDATISVVWKGKTPVALTSVVGPGGVDVTSAATPRATRATFTQRGFHAPATGDYVATLAVPADAVRWSATVQVAGRLPAGATLDFRTIGAPERPTIAFPTGGRFPIVAVVDELGGPNECVLSASGLSSAPDAAFLDGGAGAGGCARTPTGSAQPPTSYVMGCNDGFWVDASSVERYADGTWQGLVKSYVATSIRSPQGVGSSTLSDFTYDAALRPTGWTELRHFDASGRDHLLTISRAEYFPNGYCKGFRATESLMVDGAPAYTHVADYAPFR